MISAASALSGFDLPARRSNSKNRSQSPKCALRVFLRALRVSASKTNPSTPTPSPSDTNIKYSKFPVTPSAQTTYSPHHPPPPPGFHPPQPYHGTRGGNPLTVAGTASGTSMSRFSPFYTT